jgi:tetrahydromethanopterin:alpha-L-glutamate ligase
MTKIAVLGNRDGWSTNRLVEAFAKRTGKSLLIESRGLMANLEQGTVSCDDVNLGQLDAVVIKKLGSEYAPEHLDRLELLRFLHERGTPVFSAPLRIARTLNRLTCTITLRGAGIPMPPTFVTISVDDAVAAIKAYGRAVLKPLLSTKARGMRVIEAGADVRAAVREFKAEGNPILYIQKLIEIPERDLAIAFLDGNYVGTYARQRTDESAWNTTTHSGGRYASFHPSGAVVSLARRAQHLFGLEFTSVDVALTPDGPVVFEVSAFGGFRGLLEGCSIDAASLYADHVIARIS